MITHRRRTITLKLTKRKDGMFCKSIDGKLMYFGHAGCTEQQARKELIEFLRLRESGLPRVARSELPLHEIANRYLADARSRVQPQTFDDYHRAVREFIGIVGRDTLDTQLTATMFGNVREQWAAQYGSIRLGNHIQYVRTMFTWAVANLLIEKLPQFGNTFNKPAAVEVRNEHRAKVAARGVRKFSKSEIEQLIVAAGEPLRTFILLALNGGMYSVDVSDLQWEEIRREGKNTVIDRLRAKTSVPQKFVLWPELAKRFAKHGGKGRVFSTIHGNAWNNRQHKDSINLLLRRLRKRLGIARDGVGFGSFRHTHVSAVESHPDKSATFIVRGHLVEGIAKHYDIPANKRLKSVTDLARRELLTQTAQRVAAASPASSPLRFGAAR